MSALSWREQLIDRLTWAAGRHLFGMIWEDRGVADSSFIALEGALGGCARADHMKTGGVLILSFSDGTSSTLSQHLFGANVIFPCILESLWERLTAGAFARDLSHGNLKVLLLLICAILSSHLTVILGILLFRSPVSYRYRVLITLFFKQI